jgi:hypothetical protein
MGHGGLRLVLPFSNGAFFVYLAALCMVVLGGFWGLVSTGNAMYLPIILLGLFFFYLCWEAVVGKPK